MGQETSEVQAPAKEHGVRLSAMRALLTARTFRNHTSARWVVLTGQQDTGDCANGQRFARLHRERLGIAPVTLRSGLTSTSDVAIRHLVERVRSRFGAAEVQRTWGIGYRAMLAQLKRGAHA